MQGRHHSIADYVDNTDGKSDWLCMKGETGHHK